MRLKDKVAVVTGSGSGIGRATALRLAEEGAELVLGDIRDHRLPAVVAEIQSRGRRALSVKVDVTNREQVHEMVRRALDAFGRVDILVNNAGGAVAIRADLDCPGRNLEEVPEDYWERILTLNLTSTFLCSQAVLPAMKRQGYGRIINLASTLGRTGKVRNSGIAYSAAKGGIIAFTRHLAVEAGNSGVTVNAIAPGVVLTEGVLRMYQSEEEWAKRQVSDVPMARGSQPSEQAAVIAFLASEYASYITGAVIDVNGGWFIG